MKKYRELTELKGKMREKKINYAEISKQLGISVSAFSDKINGKSVFDILEASKIISILEIPKENIEHYFF